MFLIFFMHSGYPLPKNLRKTKLYSYFMELRQLIAMYTKESYLFQYLDGYEAEFCDNVSECLSYLCRLYMVSGHT